MECSKASTAGIRGPRSRAIRGCRKRASSGGSAWRSRARIRTGSTRSSRTTTAGSSAVDDAGDSWELINDERRIRQRAFYYTHVFADHHDEDVVYVQNTSFFHSTDGGATYEVINNGTHGDFHDFWIDPDDPAHSVVGNDGGGAVSFTTGGDWTDQEFSTAQFYHGVTTAHIPWHICGSQQDNSTLCLPSDWNAGRFASALADTADDSGARAPAITEGSMDVFYRSGGGEPGYIAPDPKDLDVFFSGTNNGRYIDKFNRRLGTSREVNPYPWFYSGEARDRHGRALAMDLSDHLFAHRCKCVVRVVEPAVADHRRRHQLGRAEPRPDPRGSDDAGPFRRADHR